MKLWWKGLLLLFLLFCRLLFSRLHRSKFCTTLETRRCGICFCCFALHVIFITLPLLIVDQAHHIVFKIKLQVLLIQREHFLLLQNNASERPVLNLQNSVATLSKTFRLISSQVKLLIIYWMLDYKNHIVDKNPRKIKFTLNAIDLYLIAFNLPSNMALILDGIWVWFS